MWQGLLTFQKNPYLGNVPLNTSISVKIHFRIHAELALLWEII